MGSALRFSQCAMRSVKRLHAQPTPPSSRPKRSLGKRLTTPPKTSARAKAWLAAAKWPMWLKLKLLIDSRPCQPMLPECAVTATFRSRSEEHTSELQSLAYLVCRLLLEKKKKMRESEY